MGREGRAAQLVRWRLFAMLVFGASAISRSSADVPNRFNEPPQVQSPQDIIDVLTKKIQSGSLTGSELADAYFALCQVNAQIGRMPDAIAACTQSIDTIDSTGPRMARGTIYLQAKNYPAALEDFSALTKLHPKDPIGYGLTASVYWKMGKLAKFKSESDMAIAVAANPDSGLKARGELYYDSGHWALALADFNALLRREPSNAAIFHLRGDTKTNLGDYRGGMLDYDQALKIAPKRELTLVARSKAMSFFDQRKYDDAAAQALVAADSAPGDAYALLWLHLLRAHSGKPDKEDFERRAAGVDHARWPYIIVAFELGAATEDQVWTAAEKGASFQQIADQKCEADFYLGEYGLNTAGKKADAIKLLKAATSICRKGFYEANGAAFELRAAGENIKF